MVGGRGSKEAPQIGLSRRLAEHDRVVEDKGQVLALFLGESLDHTERRLLRSYGAATPYCRRDGPDSTAARGAFRPLCKVTNYVKRGISAVVSHCVCRFVLK